MVNELRKNIGRNMRYADMNEEIDNQIKDLQMRSSYDINAQIQIEKLKRQREANLQRMRQPMTKEEYAEYDNNGEYIGNQISEPENQEQTSNNNGIGQKILDGAAHMAQGTSLGWSDEMNGIIGGTGRVMANGILRLLNKDVNGEDFSDAWRKGYQEYRDFARQELQDGYDRNPVISATDEIVGALVSPIKPFSGTTGAITNGIIGGIGMTDTNNPTEYAINIGLNTAGSVIGEKAGNMLGEKATNIFNGYTKNLPFGLSNIYKPIRVFTKAGTNGITNQISNWKKDEK